MNAFYARRAAGVAKLLARRGQTISVTRTAGGSVHPVTGVVTPGTTQTLSAKGIMRPYPDKLIDGTRITASDREVILDDSFEPALTDLLQIGGQSWSVQEVTAVNPAGTPIVYRVRARR